jgi:hypothetical protein
LIEAAVPSRQAVVVIQVAAFPLVEVAAAAVGLVQVVVLLLVVPVNF